MSNAVLPIFAGLAWSVSRKPMWSTVTKTSVSGREFRAAQFSYPTWQYRLTYELLREGQAFTEMQQLAAFFNARSGSFDSWLYTDPDDNAVVAQQFGVGDGTTRSFQLVRAFGGYLEPVYDVNGTPVVLYNGAPANLLPNSSFEQRTGALPNGWSVYNGSGVSFTLTSPTGRTGGLAYGIRADSATSTASTFGVFTAGSVVAGGLTGGARPQWASGVTYTLSFYAKKVNGAAWTAASGMALGWTTGPTSISYTSNPALTTSWQRYVVTFSWSGATEIDGALYISMNYPTIAVNDELHIDDVQLEINPTASPYVAGSERYLLSSSGLVTFDAAPGAGDLLAWTGNFYWRCRFLADALDFNQFMRQFWELRTLEFKTVKP